MSHQTTRFDSTDVIKRFKDTFDSVEPLCDALPTDRFDGDGWISPFEVVLFDRAETSHIGKVDPSTYIDAEYLRTDTIGDENGTRCYGFEASFPTLDTTYIHWVDVEYVRSLANEVFDVDYAELRSWAQTTTDEDTLVKTDAPVLFPIPTTDLTVLITPVYGPNS
jgi:hypothetical protein